MQGSLGSWSARQTSMRYRQTHCRSLLPDTACRAPRVLAAVHNWQNPQLNSHIARQYRGSQVLLHAYGNNGRQQGQPSGQPNQQAQIDLERLRQQGGYNAAPSRSNNQQQQQPWQWQQQQYEQQQQQQQQPPHANQTNPQPATDSRGWGWGGNNGNNNNNGNNGGGGLSGYTKALIAAAFVTGLGAGVYFDAEINLSPNQVASTEIIDRRTPNAEVCMAYGYSAMVFDQRVFVTYNPFNLYVTQPEVKPGCILRRSNFNVLEREKLVTDKQVESCKKRMNTFGFVGDLSKDPEVSCVYHSEEAENQYLLNPDKALQLGDKPSAAAVGGGGPSE